MQDGKALQSGTSHFLGQNFAKAFDVQFATKEGKQEYVWATSWGVSTRLMGALIMTHSDDNGLVLPPHLAPIQVVIVPIYKNDEQLKQIDAKVEGIVAKLKALGISVKYDNADNKRPGFKFADYELKGVPVRLVMGGRDLENNTMEVMRRDTLEKETVTCDNIETYVQNLLEEIQEKKFRADLYYRLNVLNLYLPPLRERQKDVFLLGMEIFNQFWPESDTNSQKTVREILENLKEYSWPGNVRELSNLMERRTA